MKAWFLFILGTLVYFLFRFEGRADRSKEPDLVFWFKDNWIQLTGAFLLDLIAMILLTDSSINLTLYLNKHIPEGLVNLTILALPVACGLGLGWGAYEFIKLFLKKKTDKIINE